MPRSIARHTRCNPAEATGATQSNVTASPALRVPAGTMGRLLARAARHAALHRLPGRAALAAPAFPGGLRVFHPADPPRIRRGGRVRRLIRGRLQNAGERTQGAPERSHLPPESSAAGGTIHPGDTAGLQAG